MNKMMGGLAAIGLTTLAGCASAPPQPNPKDMTFFVTSVGPGKGADLGGLEGADRIARSLRKAAGAPDRTWRAYLSTQAPGLQGYRTSSTRAIASAPVRGRTSWECRCAKNVDDLHSASSNLTKETALDEKGQVVNGTVDKPNGTTC